MMPVCGAESAIWILGTVVLVVGLLWRWIAKRQGSAATPLGPPRDVAALVEPLRKPCVLLRTREDESLSAFGGLPPDHPGFRWPIRNGRPLGYLACIDLSEIKALDWLPPEGLLLFFYDLDEQPWGFDPKDRGGWAVVHVADPSTVHGVATTPPGWRKEWSLPRSPIRIESGSSVPSWDHPVVEPLALTDVEQDVLIELHDAACGGAPRHQVGGYASPVQTAEMELECQLVSNGLYCGDATGYQDPRAESLKAGAADWRLLLQVDSDDGLGVMWGDLGMLYFWVRAQDARAGDFSNAWLVMQCH